MSQRRRGPPRRSSTPEQTRRIIRVHTEGKVTEPEYLRIWGKLYSHIVTLKLSDDYHGYPAGFVNQACEEMDENRSVRQRGDPLYDEIWCVFDRDNHPDIKQTINRAQQKQVDVAFSNPCFELWLVIHRQDQTAYIDRHKVKRLARDLGLTEGKAITIEAFNNNELAKAYEDAKRRAKQLDQKHFGDGSPPRSNPSTGVWRLVDSIRRAPRGGT